MEQQKRSRFIIRRYRSVVGAALVIEAVAYLVSLTDALVAGGMVSQDALTAIGLMAPFSLIITFLSATINGGTTLGFTRASDRYDRRHANEVFSQGMLTSLAVGLLFVLCMVAVRSRILESFSVSPQVRRYLGEYYDLITLYYVFMPLNAVLDNIVLNDGGEKISTVANVVQTCGNILLSLLFSGFWGVRGIALASGISQILACLILCFWFQKKKCTLKILWYFNLKEELKLSLEGGIRSVFFVACAGMVWAINGLALKRFDSDMVATLVVVEKLRDSATVFMGLSLAIQPLIGTLREEGNTKAERYLLHTAGTVVLISGFVVSLLFIAGAPLLMRVFGLNTPSLVTLGTTAIRITGMTIVFMALLMFFFIHHYLTGEKAPALLICILGWFVVPVGLVVLFDAIMGTPVGIWIGIALAPVVSLLLYAVISLLFRKKIHSMFRLHRGDDGIRIFEFPLRDENIAEMAETAGQILKEAGYSGRLQNFAQVITEEVLELIHEHNRDAEKELSVEYTIIQDREGVRLVFRDEGSVFDVTDTDANVESFRQYVVSRILTCPKYSRHVMATGYNRNEFYLEEQRNGR